MSGMELANRLHSMKLGLKVILSSGYSAEMAQLGFNEKPGIIFLPKPYEISILANLIRNFLDQKTDSSG